MRITIALLAAGLAASGVGISGHDLPIRRIPSPRTAYAAAAAFQNRRDTEETERFSRRVRMGTNGQLRLTNVSGTIVVTGGPGDDASIDAVKRTLGDRRLLDTVRIEVDERGGRVNVRTVYDNRNRSQKDGVSVDYTVTIPTQAAIDVTSVSGSVTISNVKGILSAVSISGGIRVSDAARIEYAKAISGTIDIGDSTVETDASLSTLSGSIRAHDVRGRGLQLKTASGRIEATGLACERLEMTTLSGRIELDGSLVRNGRYRLSTHSGSVRVSLSGGTGFEIDAGTFSGSIKSDFPGVLTTDRSSRDNRGQSRSARSLRGVVGDGSASLDVKTFSGSILLEKR